MPPVTRIRLLRIPEPFDHPEFIFEPKLDGFRALAHARGHRCELVSRNGHTFKSWPRPADRVSPGRGRYPAGCAMGREAGTHTMNRRDALKTLASFHGIFTATTTR